MIAIDHAFSLTWKAPEVSCRDVNSVTRPES